MKHTLKTLGFCMALAASVSGLPLAAQAAASPATEALSACLVRSATPDDQIVLTRAVFAVMAHHPGVADLATISDAQYATINKAGGVLLTRLLATDCASETSAAIRTDGQGALTVAFTALGQKTLQSLIGDRQVQASFGDMLKYVDQGALLRALMGG